MAGQHTPGPWRAHLEQATVTGHDCTFTTAEIYPTTGTYRGGVTRLQSCEHIGGIAGDELTANARLIAAAPDLLAALETMRDVIPGNWDCDATPGGKAAWDALISAIAKARGQS